MPKLVLEPRRPIGPPSIEETVRTGPLSCTLSFFFNSIWFCLLFCLLVDLSADLGSWETDVLIGRNVDAVPTSPEPVLSDAVCHTQCNR